MNLLEKLRINREESYFDASSGTLMDPEVFSAMQEYFKVEYGNPGSMHAKGLVAAHALNLARQNVAKILNADPEEIIFTGSGTESVNLALKGVAQKNKDKGKHIICTSIEHHAVLDSLEYLQRVHGFKITLIDVEENGIVDVEKIKKAITKDTLLISVMYANNEVGTIQPLKEISKLTKKNGIFLHTDACQAANSESLDVEELGVDLMTLNASKIYGPKGVGCLYKRKGIEMEPLIHGGGQEYNLRSGTENIPLIVGFSKALAIAHKNKKDYCKKLTELRDHLISELLKIDNTILNGDPKKRLPNNVNITFLNVEGESVLLKLDEKGICASSGSACASRSLDPSHVITGLGMPKEAAHGSIRFTLSKHTTKKGVDKVIEVLPRIIQELRDISPVDMTVEDIKNA